jgi:predicted nucleic acid-binding protein
MHISKCSSIEVAEHLKTCIQLSGAVPPTSPEFQFLVDFVLKNYGIFKLKELGAAFELYVLGRLDVDRNYGSFSPKFFGDVMAEYKKIAVQVRQKTQINEINEKPMQIDEEQAIKDEIEWWNKSEQKNWKFINHQVFDYMWKRKMIILSKDQGELIKAKVRAVFLAQSKKPDDMLIDDETMRQQCKKYTLMMHFNNQL